MKPPAPEPPSAAQALLEAGRKHPPLRYDVEAGLLRHQQHVQSGAPMPAWAGARGALPGGSLAWRIAKLLIAGAVAGPLVVALWPAQEPVVRAPEPAARAVPSAVAAPAAAPMPSERAPAPEAPEAPRTLARRVPHAAPPSAKTRITREQAARSETPPELEAPAPDLRAAHGWSESAPRAGSVPGISASREAPEEKPASRDSDEVRELAQAERLLKGSPQRALELVRKGDAHFPAGYLRQERAYVAIMALIELDAIAQAHAEAERFFARYPDTPYGAQIRHALAQRRSDASAH